MPQLGITSSCWNIDTECYSTQLMYGFATLLLKNPPKDDIILALRNLIPIFLPYMVTLAQYGYPGPIWLPWPYMVTLASLSPKLPAWF